MKNITIIGRERFAVESVKLVQKYGHNVNKIITDSQGILFQKALLEGIPCQLKNRNSKVLGDDVPPDTDSILSVFNFLYITPNALGKVGEAIGYHPSLLPDYPGRFAIQEALANGEKLTGGTLFYLDSGYDTGEVIAQAAIPVYSYDTAKTIWSRLEIVGLRLLSKELEKR